MHNLSLTTSADPGPSWLIFFLTGREQPYTALLSTLTIVVSSSWRNFYKNRFAHSREKMVRLGKILLQVIFLSVQIWLTPTDVEALNWNVNQLHFGGNWKMQNWLTSQKQMPLTVPKTFSLSRIEIIICNFDVVFTENRCSRRQRRYAHLYFLLLFVKRE